MDTLYELLGALPRDDADSLRTAFRRAVKGVHPDLRPDDPEAGMKFRQIVRANEILNDPEQRAAYDHLLALARLEKSRALAHPIAAKIHKVASGMMAVASASIVSVGGYLIFVYMPIPMALVPPSIHAANAHSTESNADLTSRVSASIAALPTAPDPAAMNALIAKRSAPAEKGAAPTEAPPPVVASVEVPSAESESTPVTIESVSVTLKLPDPTPRYVNLFHASRISGPHGDNLDSAGLDQALLLDPKLLINYADRGIPFYHMLKADHVFGDAAPARHTEKPSHAKSVVAVPAKHAEAPSRRAVPLPVPRSPLRIYAPRSYASASTTSERTPFSDTFQ